MRFLLYSLFVVLFFAGCQKVEELDYFVLSDQYMEIDLGTGEAYRFTMVRDALNTSILYYDLDGLSNGFINRGSADGLLGGSLNFNPILQLEDIDSSGVLVPEQLHYPLFIPSSTVYLYSYAANPRGSIDFQRRVDVYLDSWEDGIATGRFMEPALPLNDTIASGSFRVYLQSVRLN